jgi:hypothetical protein
MRAAFLCYSPRAAPCNPLKSQQMTMNGVQNLLMISTVRTAFLCYNATGTLCNPLKSLDKRVKNSHFEVPRYPEALDGTQRGNQWKTLGLHATRLSSAAKASEADNLEAGEGDANEADECRRRGGDTAS